MKLIITGPPGAGKGTMSTFIKNEYKIPHLSTGDILRDEIKKETELGVFAKTLIDKGNFVPDDTIVKIVEKTISSLDSYLLDGFPRSLSQAEIFEKMLLLNQLELTGVIYLNEKKETLIKRLSNRLVCSNCSAIYNKETKKPLKANTCDNCEHSLVQREDDKPEFLEKRLDIYYAKTEPMLNFYRKRNLLYEIESGLSISEQYSQLQIILEMIRK